MTSYVQEPLIPEENIRVFHPDYANRFFFAGIISTDKRTIKFIGDRFVFQVMPARDAIPQNSICLRVLVKATAWYPN